MRSHLTKKIVVGFVVVAVGASFGLAVALWSSTGTGSGNAKALSSQVVTVNAVTGAADLYPGASGKVFFTLTNPNPYAISFASMAPGTVTSGDPTNCPSSNVTVASATGLALTVGANTTSATQSIDNVATMATGAPDGCQGVTFTIALTLTGSQV